MADRGQKIDFAGLLVMTFCTLALTTLCLLCVGAAVQIANSSPWVAAAAWSLAALCFFAAVLILAWSIRDRLWREV